MQMNKFILTLFIFLVSVSLSHAVPAYVQSGYGECLESASCSVDFDFPDDKAGSENVDAGNLVVVSVRTDNTPTGPVTSVTINPGNQSCILGKQQVSTTTFYLSAWHCPNATGGDTTATVIISGNPDATRVVLTEYSGIATSNIIDGTPVGDLGSSDTADPGDITTTVANSMIHVVTASDGNDDWAVDSVASPGFTKPFLGPDPGPGSDKTAVEYRMVASTGTYDTSMSGGAGNWAALAVAYLQTSTSVIRNPIFLLLPKFRGG